MFISPDSIGSPKPFVGAVAKFAGITVHVAAPTLVPSKSVENNEL
jgi:hypothetical protein